MINCKDEELNGIEKNNIYYKNHKYYLDERLYKEINQVYLKKFDIELVNKIRINQIKDDNTYTKKSLFHLLINPLLQTIENPNFLIMEFKVDTYIEDLQELLTGINTDTQDLLEKYSNGSDIGFWSFNGSIIITAQLPIKDWHAYLGNETIADAMMDRLIHTAHKLELKGGSMREYLAKK